MSKNRQHLCQVVLLLRYLPFFHDVPPALVQFYCYSILSSDVVMSHNSIRRSVIIQPFLQERKWLEIELIITYAFCPLAVFTGSNCSGLRWCSKLLHYFFKGGVGQTFKRPLSRFGIILSLLSFCHFFAKTFKPSLCCLRLLSDWTLSFDLPTLQPFDGVIVILELTYSSLAVCVMIFRPRLSSRGGRNKSFFSCRWWFVLLWWQG